MPIIQLGIGLYSNETSDANRAVPYLNVHPDQRVRNLLGILDQQLTNLQGFCKVSGIRKFGLRGIFVAPEYMFSAGNGRNRPRGVPDYVKNRIVKGLTALSSKHDGILIIPGSIAWYTSVMGSGTANISAGGNLSAKEVAQELPIMEAKRKWQDPVSHNVGSMKDTGQKKHQISNLIRDYFPDRKATLRKLQKNSVPVLHNGKLIAFQDKAADFKESRRLDHLAVASPHPGCIAIKTHRGIIRIGIEVCLGHACGALREAIGAGTPPNIHVISSACVVPDRNNFCTTQGGFIIHSSSSIEFTGIWESAVAGLPQGRIAGMSDMTGYWNNPNNITLGNSMGTCALAAPGMVMGLINVNI